ncbi:hypothetical protein D3C85_1160530 [compost metagenome]
MKLNLCTVAPANNCKFALIGLELKLVGHVDACKCAGDLRSIFSQNLVGQFPTRTLLSKLPQHCVGLNCTLYLRVQCANLGIEIRDGRCLLIELRVV